MCGSAWSRGRRRPRSAQPWRCQRSGGAGGGDLEATRTPREGQREIDACRERVREPVQQQRGLVGDDPLLVTPQPGDDEILVVRRGEVAEALDAAEDTQEAARPHVVVEKGARIAGVGGLGGREVAVLGGGEGVEGGPGGIGHPR